MLCPKCLMHYRIWAHVGTFGCRLKGQWGRGGEAFREGGEGRVRVRDSHSPGVQESQEGLWGQGKNMGEREHDPPRRFLRAQMGLQCKGVLRNEA